MTSQEYYTKSLCYYCSLGQAAYKYALKLSLGQWDEECKLNLIIANSLVEIFMNFNPQELVLWDGTYSNLTEEEFQELMEKIEELI